MKFPPESSQVKPLQVAKKSDNQISMKSKIRKAAAAQNASKKTQIGATQKIKRKRVISATEAARSFSELLDRVCYRGETFVIDRGGELVCEMSHVTPAHFTGADFIALLDSLPKPDSTYWDAVEEATRQKPSVPKSRWER